MEDTALVVLVPEAEQYVAALRNRYDPAAAEGVPAHITILYPFIPHVLLSRDALSRVQLIASQTEPFSFRISSPARFPDTVYLRPEPAQPFIEMTLRVVREFPDYPPYGRRFDSIVPHLTVAQGAQTDLADAERLLVVAQPSLGFTCRCDMLTLIEKSSGRWRESNTFDLGVGSKPFVMQQHR